TSKDPDSVLEMLRDPGSRQTHWQLVPSLGVELSKRHDLATALQIAEEMPNMYTRSSLRNSIIQSYAQEDPRGALQYALKNHTSPQDTWITSSIFSLWSLSNPEEAKAEALRLKDPRHRRQALASIGGVLAHVDPKEAIEWAQSMPDRV